MSLSEKELKNYIITHYPNTQNEIIAKNLGISVSTVIRRASKYGVKKSKSYMEKLHKNLLEQRKVKYNINLKNYSLTNIERNIIVGSLLGDGSLAIYGRSKNAYYREHGSDSQREYRIWKAKQLSNLDFKFNDNCKYGKLSSPSHPIYTNLYNIFYKNGVKIINSNNIKLLDHPIGLACLYMDDGTLVINPSKKRGKIYLSPHISIYTLNFTKSENELLIKHIKDTFGITFILKKRPDGNHYILQLNKRNELMKFIDIVKKYVLEIPCMHYKVNVLDRLKEKQSELIEKYPEKEIIICSLKIKDNSYTKEEEKLIVEMKSKGRTYKEIADTLGRSYWGITDKIRRMKNIS